LKQTDLVLYDYFPPTPLTRENIFGHALFGIGNAPVNSLIASGRFVIRDRQFVTVDERAVADGFANERPRSEMHDSVDALKRAADGAGVTERALNKVEPFGQFAMAGGEIVVNDHHIADLPWICRIQLAPNVLAFAVPRTQWQFGFDLAITIGTVQRTPFYSYWPLQKNTGTLTCQCYPCLKPKASLPSTSN
jgi:hypothetical protein